MARGVPSKPRFAMRSAVDRMSETAEKLQGAQPLFLCPFWPVASTIR
jgi:hypothetical protein